MNVATTGSSLAPTGNGRGFCIETTSVNGHYPVIATQPKHVSETHHLDPHLLVSALLSEHPCGTERAL